MPVSASRAWKPGGMQRAMFLTGPGRQVALCLQRAAR
jgi:hypothetical protein